LGRSIQCRERVRESGAEAVLHGQLQGSGVPGIEHGWIPDLRGDSGKLCDGRRHQDSGTTTEMPAWNAVPGVHFPQGGTESQPFVLEVPTTTESPMSVIRMDAIPTLLERDAVPAHDQECGIIDRNKAIGEQGFITEEHAAGDTSYVHSELTEHSNGQRGDISMPPHSSDPPGNQWLNLSGTMCRLREVAEEGEQTLRQRECQEQRIEGQVGPISPTPDDQGDVGRIPGVPGVPQVASVQAATERGERERLTEETPPTDCESKETGNLNRRQRRTLKQARTALEAAERNWNELMSLLRTDADQAESVAWSRCDSSCADRRNRQKYLWLLQRTEKQLKTVAELYNPNRFKDRLDRYGLCPGQAFDLKLGHDLTSAGMRQEVRRYVQQMKPGLVVISPPCTLFSLLQNLTKRSPDPETNPGFLRKLIEAKVLLRFGIEIAFEVLKYGGSFLFEHPLTSRAWMDVLHDAEIDSAARGPHGSL